MTISFHAENIERWKHVLFNRESGLCDRRLDSLEQIPALRFWNDGTNACISSSVFEAVRIHSREENYRHGWIGAGHHSCGFEAIDVGHCQVQQDQVGLRFLKFLTTQPPAFASALTVQTAERTVVPRNAP